VDTFKTGAEIVTFMPLSGVHRRRSRPAVLALFVVVLLAGWQTADATVLAGLGPLVLGASAGTLRGLVAAIGVGAVVVGAIAWLGASVAGGPVAPPLAAGLGVAVGGGLGSVVWLLAVGDETETETEAVTVDMREDETAVPSPEPADLFEASPDPILFYGGPEPAVRAANPAFADAFGTDPGAVEGRPLGDALRVETGGTALVEAAVGNRPADETLPCALDGGTADVRVRVVPTRGGDSPAGYVVYGPLDGAS